jgi:hypothetical protein
MFLKYYLLPVVLLFSVASSAIAQSPAPMPDKRIKILLIGTWHFDVNSTNDRNTSNLTDLISPKRRREIDSLTTQLASFQPDKFFVESVPARQARWDSLYQLMQQGKASDTVSRNEIFQIGLKTAWKAGLKRGVTCVDVRQNIRMDKYETFTEAHKNDPDSVQNRVFSINFCKPVPSFKKLATTRTVGGMLLAMNTRDYLLNDNYDYSHWFLGANAGDDYAGVDGTISWYERNLKIFVNVLRNVDLDKDQRYILLYGAAHIPQLKHYFANHPLFEVVELNTILN